MWLNELLSRVRVRVRVGDRCFGLIFFPYLCRVGVRCTRYLMHVYSSLGVIEFVLLSQCVSLCGCMSSYLGLGLGLGRDDSALFSCFECAGLEFVVLGV